MTHHNDSSGAPLILLFFGAIFAFTLINALRRAGSGGSLTGWLMSLFTLFKKADPETLAQQAASEARQAEIITNIKHDRLPKFMYERLNNSRDGVTPWIATLNPAELRINRSHGIRPIAAVSATCWMHYGWSWTQGHAQGWETALRRLKDEAIAAGANAVLDVKMRTVPMDIDNSMDFTLIGTAVKIDDLPPSDDPIVATVPALEFVKLLEANVVPVGIAVGAEFRWISDWQGSTSRLFVGNMEYNVLTDHWKYVRDRAFYQLRQNAKKIGTGALAHVNFSQMFEQEGGNNGPKQYLARHIVIATVVDAPQLPEWAMRSFPEIMGERLPDMQMVVDLCAGKTPLTRKPRFHESYASNDEEGGV